MRALKAKELTKQAQEIKQNRYISKHERYAKKITDKKVRKAALKGFSSAIIKPSMRLNKALLADKIREFGYDVKVGSKDMKINW